MRYLKIDTCDLNNGHGARVTLWVSGCNFRCNGCHNKESWDFNNGELFTDDTKKYLIELIKSPYINGLSILGGEPLSPPNRKEVLQLCKEIKLLFNDTKDIWLWTGYQLNDIYNEELFIDILIDGQFDINKPTKKKFRGSDNQIMWKHNWDKNIFEKID